MAAPAGGVGRYRIDDIEYVLVTAFTAFRAAVLESARARGSDCPVVVHSGSGAAARSAAIACS